MLAVEIIGQTFPVEVVTSNDRVHTDASGLKLEPHLLFGDVHTHNYVALLVPGGNPDSIVGKASIQKIIVAAYTAGLVVGGICAGVLLLADSEILQGPRITHNYTAKYAPQEVVENTSKFWENTEVIDVPCLKSENVVTALPHGYVDFAVTLAWKLGVYTPKQAERMNRYYKGQPYDSA